MAVARLAIESLQDTAVPGDVTIIPVGLLEQNTDIRNKKDY